MRQILPLSRNWDIYALTLSWLFCSDILNKINYNHEKDVFVHVGDFIARGPVPEALSLLSEFAKNDTLGELLFNLIVLNRISTISF